MTIAWPNEEAYQLGDEFLAKIGALYFPPESGKPGSFYLDSREQLHSLYEFRRSLEGKQRIQQ
jgi:hypothetical protein